MSSPTAWRIGNRAHLAGLNIVGLKRRGFSREASTTCAAPIVCSSPMKARLPERVEDVAGEFATHPVVHEILDFIREGGNRAICTPRDAPRAERDAGRPPGPVAIIAGGGALPGEIARGRRGAADAAAGVIGVARLRRRDRAQESRCGTSTCWTRARDPDAACEIGLPARDRWRACVTRPGPLALGSRLLGLSQPRGAGRIGRGDDQLLRGAVRLLEENGFPWSARMTSRRSFWRRAGALTARAPDSGRPAPISRSACGCSSISPPFDIGQGVVVAGGQVLAVEGPEGTDAHAGARRASALGRRELRRRRRRARQGAEAGQDVRVDLPAIGPRTIVKARERA